MATPQKATSEIPSTEVPAQIQNGFALVNFVDATLERDKKDNGFILYRLSIKLTDEHEKYVPRKIRKAWEGLLECELKTAKLKEIKPHAIELAIAPDGDDKALEVDAALIEKISLDMITEKGTGKARNFVRLMFSIRFSLGDSTLRFARIHFGHNVWLKLEQAQKELYQ